jgi:hypothetical protein
MATPQDLLALKNEMEKTMEDRETKLLAGWKQEIDALRQKLEEVTKKYDVIKDKEQDGKKEKSLMHIKNLVPSKLEKTEDWRKWRQEVEDYTEEVFPGMKGIMDKARKSNDVMKQMVFMENDLDVWWHKRETLQRFLKHYTENDAHKTVNNVAEENGWEAWRKLCNNFEPNLAIKEAQLKADFTMMVNRRAKNMTETKALITEMEDKAKKAEDISGESIGKAHAGSVIMGILDHETLKHVAMNPENIKEPEVMKRKAMEFVNMMIPNIAENGKSLGSLGMQEEEECDQEEEDSSRNHIRKRRTILRKRRRTS